MEWLKLIYSKLLTCMRLRISLRYSYHGDDDVMRSHDVLGDRNDPCSGSSGNHGYCSSIVDIKRLLQAQKKGYSGPTLGPKMAEKNVRHFSEDQKKAGSGVIGLQMGSNKGANQSGINFGQTRHI